MPLPTTVSSQFVATDRVMVADHVLVPLNTPVGDFHPIWQTPPQGQPLGNTPLSCDTPLTGSNNQIFLENPTGNAFYFADYSIAVDGGGKPRVKFAQPDKTQTATSLTIHLVAAPPPIAAGASANPCPPKYCAQGPAVRLYYSNGTQHVDFDEVTPDSDGTLMCVAHMTVDKTIGEVMGAVVSRDTDPSHHAWLTITQTILSVGVLVATQPVPTGGGRVPPFELERATLERSAVAASTADTIAVNRTRSIWWPPRPSPFPPPVPVPQPPTKLYNILANQPVTATIRDVWFSADHDADILGDVNVTPRPAGYRKVPVAGYDDPLFQDLNADTSYYYLPHAFKIARRDKAPFLPLLNVTISGDTMDDAKATVFFVAVPVVDMQKLNAAEAQLQASRSGETVTLQPLPTPNAIKYGLFLPGTPQFQDRSAVPVALDQSLTDSLPQMSLGDFQTAFASLTIPVAQYLQGIVTVPVSDDHYDVPLIARADDFPGEYFEQARAVDTTSGAIKLTLTNAIENAVQVDGLPIQATRAGAAVACVVTYDPPLPAKIAAADDDHPTGGTLTVTVTPGSGPLDDTLSLVVDQSQCHVEPDAAGLLRAVLDPNVPIKKSTPVTVQVPPGLFGKDTDPDEKKIILIKMNFMNGNTITFNRPADVSDPTKLVSPDKAGEVDVTVFDYLLHQASNAINYKLAITYFSSHTVTDSNWRTAPGDNFILDLP